MTAALSIVPATPKSDHQSGPTLQIVGDLWSFVPEEQARLPRFEPRTVHISFWDTPDIRDSGAITTSIDGICSTSQYIAVLREAARRLQKEAADFEAILIEDGQS